MTSEKTANPLQITQTRRRFLGRAAFGVGLGLTLGPALLPPIARAATPSKRKFIFVFAQGGWDPTRVFATEFANPRVDMEAAADLGTAGGLRYVRHPNRPSVDAFMDAWHDRTVIFNGVMVGSIAHEICTMRAMTGATSGLAPDWPAILANHDRGAFALPHLVLGGPSFPGEQGVAVARPGTAGRRGALASGQALVDGFATQDARGVRDLQYLTDLAGGAGLAEQAAVAVDVLRNGISRCLTLSAGSAFSWDTHARNDAGQSPLWEDLYGGLGQLVHMLASAPGELEPTLLDETTVVVLSEMGRAPGRNGLDGKDHWPYTSIMMVGAGLTGDRVVGGFDAAYHGERVDPASGDVAASAPVLSAQAIGATLLALADVDPAGFVTGAEPIRGVIA